MNVTRLNFGLLLAVLALLVLLVSDKDHRMIQLFLLDVFALVGAHVL